VLFCLNCQKPTPRDPILAVSPQLPSCIFQNCCLRRETTKRKKEGERKGTHPASVLNQFPSADFTSPLIWLPPVRDIFVGILSCIPSFWYLWLLYSFSLLYYSAFSFINSFAP
jgi:hypothetical protein